MDSRSFRYSLVWKNFEITLFASQFRFGTEELCLRHYEKGIARRLFEFDRARINQVWSELCLWGLIGRIHPVELVRILCAFGCEIKLMDDDGVPLVLQKSFEPVNYFIPVASRELIAIRHFYHWPLEPRSFEHVPLFLEMDDRVVLGSFYFTADSDVDSQFPIFCEMLERDLCFPIGSVRTSLFRFFHDEYKIVACSGADTVTLAHLNKDKTIHGFNFDQALFYVGAFDEAA